MYKKNIAQAALLLSFMLPPAALAELIAADVSADGPVNLIAYDNPFTDAFSSAGDGFQIYTRGVSPSIPFSLADDSISVFPSDALGIVDENDTAPFFGITDTVNGDTSGPVSASWVFDISGGTELALSIDFAAMGDFETSDTLVVTYSIDGGATATAFEIVVDEAIAQEYTLASGSMFTLNDPATLQDTLLDNRFQTFATTLDGSGSELTLTLTASANGGSEALALRNINVFSGGLPVQAVAFDMVDSGSERLLSFSNPFAGAFASAGDGFQKYRRGVSASIPFSVLDDSLVTFPADALGIIDDNNLDEFFGATDTQNGDNSGPVSATWEFDITGATQLGLSIDMGAMGDFEGNDFFSWTYSIDGGETREAFAGSADEAAVLDYTLAGGRVVTLNDPLQVDGTLLTNVLTPFTTALEGEGSTLTLTLTVQTDGGSEAMAFQNLLVLEDFEPDEPVVIDAEIYEIQGDGATSPFVGMTVRTQANVVTAVGPEGFFMQTPASRSDGNVDTSDGVYVFTGSAPAVAVGDLVDVEGDIVEFFGLTEFEAGASVSVTGSGAALPAPVVFDASVPSPDPAAPSCAIEFECYEGMLVSIGSGRVTGPNQSFGTDPVAEVFITAGIERSFREPGVEFPGLGGSIPTWDGNPEVFELDPDKLGLDNQKIVAGSVFSATGVIGFEFGGYELWPTALSVTQPPLPLPVRERGLNEFTVGSLNMFRLFDSVDDPSDFTSQGRERDDVVVPADEYAVRLNKLAAYVVNVLDAPEILAVQEVEKLGVLEDLAAVIATLDSGIEYRAILQEGNDVGTIDVGFLVRRSIVIDAVEQIGKDDILDFDGSLLNDRPPLLLKATQTANGAALPLAVIVVHNRSLGGIDSSSSGERVRAKRLQQAQAVAAAAQALQQDDPDVNLVVLGDFNAFEFSDGFVDVSGQIEGDIDAAENLLSGPDLVDPNLINLTELIDADDRYSFIFRGSAQALDHALISANVLEYLRGYMYGRGNADAPLIDIETDGTPLRSSDHDGLVVFLTTDLDGDGVPENRDQCPGTVIPEALDPASLGQNRYALLDGDFVFEYGGRGNAPTYSTDDTAGCSCEQIVAALGLGRGHVEKGCTRGTMQRWVSQ